jgi:ATP-dependent Clp protease ATP-binding subunit ClpC
MEYSKELYFNNPHLQMGSFQRLIARIAGDVFIIILTVSVVVFFLMSAPWLKWSGILLGLFLLDRIVYSRGAERMFSELPVSGPVNVFLYMSPEANSSIVSSFDKSMVFGGNFFLHLAVNLLEKNEVREALVRLDVDVDEFGSKLNEYLKKTGDAKNSHDELINKITKLTSFALNVSVIIQSGNIVPVDLFAALGSVGDEHMDKLFGLFEINVEDLEKAIIFGRYHHVGWWGKAANLSDFASQPYNLRHRFMNRAWTARPTPALDCMSVDLTDMARAGRVGFLVGHQNEYEELVSILSRPDKPNALMVGEMGRGSIVGHLAFMIVQDLVPKPLFDKRVVMLDLNALIAGADQAELQARIKRIFHEINQAGNIILYIPDIHNLSRTASEARQISVSSTLIPLIISNDFPTIGTTYPKEFKQFIEVDSSFVNAFQVINISEISVAETEIVLTYESLILEKEYKVKIAYSAIKIAARLAYKYFRQKLLPVSASDLLKESLAEVSRTGDKVLNADDVVALASRRSNIPINKVDGNERNKLLHLEDFIHERLVDQEPAVKAVSQALREYRSGLTRNGGPIGSFLFVGPTGVGKTELSKILADVLFGSPTAMIRFDMSEYQDKQSICRLIGSSDGVISGALTDAVSAKPYSLILLDEFEKAHPDVINIFLQVLDDGRLTNNIGKTVNFQNTIIIATSNAHSDFIKAELDKGRSMEEISFDLKKKLISCFKPELLNRFSEIIVFKNLSQNDIFAITRFMLNDLAVILKTAQGISLNFSDEAVKEIAGLGYDPIFGARPIQKVISDKLRAPLSEMILTSKAKRGMTIDIVLENGEIKLKT